MSDEEDQASSRGRRRRRESRRSAAAVAKRLATARAKRRRDSAVLECGPEGEEAGRILAARARRAEAERNRRAEDNVRREAPGPIWPVGSAAERLEVQLIWDRGQRELFRAAPTLRGASTAVCTRETTQRLATKRLLQMETVDWVLGSTLGQTCKYPERWFIFRANFFGILLHEGPAVAAEKCRDQLGGSIHLLMPILWLEETWILLAFWKDAKAISVWDLDQDASGTANGELMYLCRLFVVHLYAAPGVSRPIRNDAIYDDPWNFVIEENPTKLSGKDTGVFICSIAQGLVGRHGAQAVTDSRSEAEFASSMLASALDAAKRASIKTPKNLSLYMKIPLYLQSLDTVKSFGPMEHSKLLRS